jgi:hypothetical protein
MSGHCCCNRFGIDLFTQTDPLQPTVGSAYPSAYVYGNNNPVRFVDPTGLRSTGAAMSSPSPKQIPDSCVFSTYNWSYCLHGQFQSRSAIDPTDLTNVKYVGAFLDENAGPIWPHLGGFRWSDLAPP